MLHLILKMASWSLPSNTNSMSIHYCLPLPAACCIFRVPSVLKSTNKNAYQPQIVSLGPFHRKNEKTQDMEKAKLWYLHSLLFRIFSDDPDGDMRTLIRSMRVMEKPAIECYSEPMNLNTDDFIEMLTIDGCFIIELFLKKANEVAIDKSDPLVNMSCMREYLFHDLLLLENQLPWFILESLFSLTKDLNKKNLSLNELGISFFGGLFSMSPSLDTCFKGETLHLLDLIRNMLISPCGRDDNANKVVDDKWEMIPSVSHLSEAGVKLKKGASTNILDIKFRNGLMEIPPLLIRELTESIFGNLIAYEQCYSGSDDQVTSYAVLLDCLIDSSKDVEILCNKEILHNWLSTEVASKFFDRLYHDTYVTRFYYAGLCDEVNSYYGSKWNTWRALLVHNGQPSPSLLL